MGSRNRRAGRWTGMDGEAALLLAVGATLV